MLADGSITSSRDKSGESTQFCLHIINVPQHNMRPNSGPFVYTPPIVSVDEAAPAAGPAVSAQPPPVVPVASASAPSVDYSSSSSSSKEQEAAAYDAYRSAGPSNPPDGPPPETPPTYTNLFPQLPK